jgi:hypothetical protein
MMELNIDEEIFERLKQRATESGFDSTEEYVNTVLAEFLSEIESDSSDHEQQENIQQRLEDLGYL